ncbi:MAG: cytochrome c family protein [Myxococcales bacterium]|nr:cytochrome c family protein [Myxococcales bacterium]
MSKASMNLRAWIGSVLFLVTLLVSAGFAFADGAPVTHGTEALPAGAKVPLKWLPPGAFEPDRGPSDVVFPAQQMTLRFNHKGHLALGLKCASCHAAGSSQKSSDDLIPTGRTCDTCHATDHGDLGKVLGGGSPTSECAFCHTLATDGTKRVLPFRVPKPNMVFNHKKHLDRNINCQQCHGAVEELELATRDQLPRMRGCLGCHQMTDTAARGDAKGACETCHVTEGSNGATQLLPERKGVQTGFRMKTAFPEGTLKPPRWLGNAAHGPDFIDRHKMVAASNSELCANCHKEDFCTGCHDGRVRPKNIHPGDYLQMHPVDARLASSKCTSCHREQSFCLGCHQRLGISMSGPKDVREAGRFHPPKQIWSDAPRKPGHHSQDAQRNLNACVSCHIERDCVTCHGGPGIGGGFNPHNSSFVSSCSYQYKRNPRPCLVCHEPGSKAISTCR